MNNSSGPSSGMFFGLWILSIIIGIVLYRASPPYPAATPRVRSMRTQILVWGFIPCIIVNIVISFGFFLAYRTMAGRSAAEGTRAANELQQRLSKTFDAPPPPPRNTGGSQESQADNPFL